MDKKKVFWAILFIFIAGFSIWAVASQSKSLSFNSFISYVMNSDPKYMILAVLSAFGFIFFEGMAILVIIKSFGYPRKGPAGILYSAADIYFSAITPSATGGQPASAYFMLKDGIPSATVTVALLLNLVMYTTALMTVGVIAVIFGFPIFINFSTVSKVFIIIGLVVQILLTIFFLLLLGKRSLTEKICTVILKIGKKLRLIRHYDQTVVKLNHTMDEFQKCSELIKDRKGMIVKAYLFNLFQRICNVSVSALVFLAGGGALKEANNIWLAQSYVALGANSVPIPGSMGVTDYLMIDAFSQFLPEEAVPQLELLSRSLSFYICILVCSITTLIGYVVFKKRGAKS